MTQPLYTEQDNKDFDAKIKETFGSTTHKPELVMPQRGMNPAILHHDDAGFIPEPVSPTTPTPKSPSPPFDTMNQKTSFTDGGIVVNTPNQPQFQLSPEMIRQAQAQLEEGGAIVLNTDGSKQMFNNIKDMFAEKANKPVVQPKIYFVEGKSKFHFGIDKTNLEPTAIVRLAGKNFEAKYLAQLESYLYNSKDELDPEKLMMFIYLVSFIEKDHFPIKIVTGRHRIQLPKIIKTLNIFFNKNWTVLSGIAKMFNAMPMQEPQTSSKE